MRHRVRKLLQVPLERQHKTSSLLIQIKKKISLKKVQDLAEMMNMIKKLTKKTLKTKKRHNR